MKELIRQILKEDNLKQDLKKVIEDDGIFQAADLVGGLTNLKRLFKGEPEISSMFENLTGTITFYYYLGNDQYMKNMKFPLKYEIIGRKSNIHKTNHWPEINVIYDENKLDPEENDTFKSMIKYLIDETNHSDFDTKKFGNYKLFNVNYITVKELNGENIDLIGGWDVSNMVIKNIHNKLYGKGSLNESVDERKEFDKGVNIAVKMLSKKFNFVVDWELAEPADKYKYTVFINLFVSLEKVKKYYGIEVSEMYMQISDYIYTTEHSKAYPFSALDYKYVIEEPYKVNKELTNTFEEIYNDLPDHLKMERNDEDRHVTTYEYKGAQIDGYKYVI
jgi:hypothetical protein